MSHSTATKSAAVVVPGNCVAVILWLYSSVQIIWTRKQFVLFHIQFISFLPCCSHLESVVVLASVPALRVRRRVLFFVVFVPVTFKFVPFLVCLSIAHVSLVYSLYNLSGGGMKTPEAAIKHFQFYNNNLPFERATLQR